MTAAEFRRSVTKAAPPAGASHALQALWWAARDDWTRAHDIVMAHEGDHNCDWVHAYLHRVEGDLPNANWWYRQAKRAAADGPLAAEWTAMVTTLLADG
jgi:hypothetical protein